MTISIGGNDAQFATVFLFCLAYPECHRIKPFEGVSDLVLGDLAPLLIASAGLKVLDVHTRLHDALPDATVVVLGYPILLSGAECPAVRFPPSAKSGVKLSSSEQAFLREMNASLNTVIAESAAIAGLHHVAVADRFTGHEICGVADDWINGTAPLLTPWFNPKATVHPTARGQLEYANALNAYLASTSASPPNGLLPQGLPRNPAPAAGARRILAQRAAATRTDLPAFGALQVAFAVPGTGARPSSTSWYPARTRGCGATASRPAKRCRSRSCWPAASARSERRRPTAPARSTSRCPFRRRRRWARWWASRRSVPARWGRAGC